MGLTYGKPQDWTEDMYSMKGDDTGPQSTANFFGTNMGENNAQYPQEVIISCPNKMGRVRASMGGPIQLNVSSQWEPMFGGGIASMTNSILGTANQLIEWSMGCTIQQPWMNRKNYKNTMPFTFTLPLNFVAIRDAKDDVVKPCLALVSFLYPRKYNPDDNQNQSRYDKYNAVRQTSRPSSTYKMTDFGNTNAAEEAGWTAFEEINKSKIVPAAFKKLVTSGDKTDVVGSLLDMFEIWEIPGPSLLTGSNANGAHKGDVIDIIVGKMFNLGNCYLENVDVNFGTAFDKNGYPLSAKVNVKCTCADSVVCSSTGNLLVNQVVDQSEKLSKFVGACTDTIANLADNISNLFKLYKGYYSGGLQIQEATSK
jgi:hypothetical protein